MGLFHTGTHVLSAQRRTSERLSLWLLCPQETHFLVVESNGNSVALKSEALPGSVLVPLSHRHHVAQVLFNAERSKQGRQTHFNALF